MASGRAETAWRWNQFVHGVGVRTEPFLERRQPGVALRTVHIGKRQQRGHAVGHVVRRKRLRASERHPSLPGCSEVAEGPVAQGPPPRRGRIRAVGFVGRQPVVELPKPVPEPRPDGGGQGAMGPVDPVHIDLGHALGNRVGTRQREDFGGERRVVPARVERGTHRFDEDRVRRQAGVGHHPVQHRRPVFLAGLPTGEGIAVTDHQEGQFRVAALHLQPDRGAEAPVEGQCERLRESAMRDLRTGVAENRAGRRHHPPSGIEQRVIERDGKRFLIRLPRGRRRVLFDHQRIAVGTRSARNPHLGRSRLRIPEGEPPQVRAVGVRHGRQEVVAGHRPAVMPCHVQVDALPVALRPEQGPAHPHHLGALLVDRRSVEVVDLDVLVRTDRMGERSRILRELPRAQGADIRNPLDRGRPHIGHELLVAEDRQPLLEAQLEPIPAGDPIAGPVVEVLVRNDPFDEGVVLVGRGLRIRQYELRIEDIEALVLHGPHVEVRHGDDVEQVQVVLEAVDLLVPAHGALEGVHGVCRARLVARRHMDGERDLPPGTCDEAVLQRTEFPGDQREQVARLGPGILPDRLVAHAHIPVGGAVAVREQYGSIRLVGADRDPIAAHDVGAVREVGYAPKALGLALGAIAPFRTVEALETGVSGRVDHHFRRNGGPVRNTFDDNAVPILRICRRGSVDGQRDQVQLLAVEPQRCVRCATFHRELGPHPRRCGMELEIQRHLGNGEVRGPVGAPSRRGRQIAHRYPSASSSDGAPVILRPAVTVFARPQEGGRTRAIPAKGATPAGGAREWVAP